MIAPPLRSQLLTGTVRHRRTRHATYDFTHPVWYLALDLAELDRIGPWPLLAYERTAALTVRDGDHLRSEGRGLRASVDNHLQNAGLDPGTLRVTLVTYPRVMGFVFNPVSFYLCHSADGALRHVIAEVSNTHGDREIYDFPPMGEGGPVFHSTALKRMYVSPFIGDHARYDLTVSESRARLAIAITEYEEGAQTLYAGIEVMPHLLSARELLRVLARDPLVSARTVALIAWHAARLRWRGVRWNRYRRPAMRPADPVPRGRR